jgi:serine/threonine protein kinase
MTGVGMLIGTAAYMSPEQAKGKPADRQSDLWAFGCVLFEMLTGNRAFSGDDITETLASIIKSEPQWTWLPAGTPASVRRLLRRCLSRDRALRLHDAGDARLDLADTDTSETAADHHSGRTGGPHRAWVLAGIVATLAVIERLLPTRRGVLIPDTS